MVSVFLIPLNGLFSPTSQSPMSKLFRFSKSLGKNNGKNWSQIWQLSLIYCVKLQSVKFFCSFSFLSDFWHLLTLLKCLFSPTSQSPMSKKNEKNINCKKIKLWTPSKKKFLTTKKNIGAPHFFGPQSKNKILTSNKTKKNYTPISFL